MQLTEEAILRAKAVKMIQEGRTEDALEILSEYYKVQTPKLKIGLPKRCRKAYGCYVAKEKTIYLRSSDEYTNPFVVLHEFYHHIRWRLGSHRGTEKHADKYALQSIQYYKLLTTLAGERNGEHT